MTGSGILTTNRVTSVSQLHEDHDVADLLLRFHARSGDIYGLDGAAGDARMTAALSNSHCPQWRA